jgi:hypothetical protein
VLLSTAQMLWKQQHFSRKGLLGMLLELAPTVDDYYGVKKEQKQAAAAARQQAAAAQPAPVSTRQCASEVLLSCEGVMQKVLCLVAGLLTLLGRQVGEGWCCLRAEFPELCLCIF